MSVELRCVGRRCRSTAACRTRRTRSTRRSSGTTRPKGRLRRRSAPLLTHGRASPWRSLSAVYLRGCVMRPGVALCVCSLGCSPPRQISDSGFGAYEVSLAAWNDGLAVAWYDTRHGTPRSTCARSTDGRNAGAELRLTTTPTSRTKPTSRRSRTRSRSRGTRRRTRRCAARATRRVVARRHAEWSAPIAVGTGEQPQSRRAQLRRRVVLRLDRGRCRRLRNRLGRLVGARRPPARRAGRLGAASETTWNLNAAIGESGAASWCSTRKPGHAGRRAVPRDARRRPRHARAAERRRRRSLEVSRHRARGRDARVDVVRRARRKQRGISGGRAFVELLSSIEPLVAVSRNTPGASIGAYVAWNRRPNRARMVRRQRRQLRGYFQSFDAAGNPLAPSAGSARRRPAR